MRNSFEIMEAAWAAFAAHWRALIVLPFGMFLASLLPSVVFPWSVLPDTLPPNEQAFNTFIFFQIAMLIVYLFLFYTYLIEVWRILKKQKYTHRKLLNLGLHRFLHTLGAHIVTIVLIAASAGAYILLYWLLLADAVATATPVMSWPLVLGLPLLAPALYFTVRYVATVPTSAIDDTAIAEAFHESSALTKGRWWDTCVRLFTPAVLWSIGNLVLTLAVLIVLFVILSINPTQFTLTQSYIVAGTNGLIESLIFMPLTTISIIILYADLKKPRKK